MSVERLLEIGARTEPGEAQVVDECQVKATMSICCGIIRAGWHKPSVMHSGACRDKHGGELGQTYYLDDSGLVMDKCGIMRPRYNEFGDYNE